MCVAPPPYTDAQPYVRLAFAPVSRQTCRYSVYPFRQDKKVHIRTLLDNVPRLLPPFIGAAMEEVGKGTGKYSVSLVLSFGSSLYLVGQVPRAFSAIYLAPRLYSLLFLQNAPDITVGAFRFSAAYLVATVPRIPRLVAPQLLLTPIRRGVCSTWMPVGRGNSYAG